MLKMQPNATIRAYPHWFEANSKLLLIILKKVLTEICLRVILRSFKSRFDGNIVIFLEMARDWKHSETRNTPTAQILFAFYVEMLKGFN